MKFNEHGLKCCMKKKKGVGARVEKELLVSFLGVDVSSLLMLAYVKSWVQAYLYNKIGSMKSSVDCYGDDRQGYLSFDKSQKGGEVFLYAVAHLNGQVLNEVTLNYQQVVMLDVALNKAISFLDVDC